MYILVAEDICFRGIIIYNIDYYSNIRPATRDVFCVAGEEEEKEEE